MKLDSPRISPSREIAHKSRRTQFNKPFLARYSSLPCWLLLSPSLLLFPMPICDCPKCNGKEVSRSTCYRHSTTASISGLSKDFVEFTKAAVGRGKRKRDNSSGREGKGRKKGKGVGGAEGTDGSSVRRVSSWPHIDFFLIFVVISVGRGYCTRTIKCIH